MEIFILLILDIWGTNIFMDFSIRALIIIFALNSEIMLFQIINRVFVLALHQYLLVPYRIRILLYSDHKICQYLVELCL